MARCPTCKSKKLSPVGDSGMLRCADCGAEFDGKLARPRLPRILIKVALAIATILTILFILSRFLFSSSSAAMKPVIYLYAPGEQKEKVTLSVKGRITARIPHRPGISSITWDGLTLKDGKILDSGKTHDYLFYESENVMPKHQGTGWVLERCAGKTTWNGELVDREALVVNFRELLKAYGLFENEIADFTDYWLTPDMKMFFGKEEFAYAIHPIPTDELDRIFAIETDIEYWERVRVQLLVRDVPPETRLQPPSFPGVVRAECALHEWGVIRG